MHSLTVRAYSIGLFYKSSPNLAVATAELLSKWGRKIRVTLYVGKTSAHMSPPLRPLYLTPQATGQALDANALSQLLYTGKSRLRTTFPLQPGYFGVRKTPPCKASSQRRP